MYSMAFLTVSRSLFVKGRRSRKLSPTYSGRGFAERLGAAEGLRLSAFDEQGDPWGAEVIGSRGPGDTSSEMEIIEVPGEQDSARGLEHVDKVDTLLGFELAGDRGGVGGFSADKTRLRSSACMPGTMALLLLFKWAKAAPSPDVSAGGTLFSDALSSESWSATVSSPLGWREFS